MVQTEIIKRSESGLESSEDSHTRSAYRDHYIFGIGIGIDQFKITTPSRKHYFASMVFKWPITFSCFLFCIYPSGNCNKHRDSSFYEFRKTDYDLTPEFSKTIRVGTSSEIDAFGNRYQFFICDPNIDNVVSSTMINSGGMWEGPLNMLFKGLVQLERVNRGQHAFQEASVNLRGNQINEAKSHHSGLNVVDLGVNFGAFTLFAASQGANVYGFEIQRNLLSLVDMGLRVNDFSRQVKLYNVAASDRYGLNYTYESVVHNPGMTSAHYQPDPISSTSFNGKKRRVGSERMDYILGLSNVKNIFFLKLDCEGCEPVALLGLDKPLLNRRIKHIAIEITWKLGQASKLFILEILYLIGYTCELYDDKQDCLYPAIEPQCEMPTYAAAQAVFLSRRPYSHWNEYMDVHCQLPAWATDEIPSSQRTAADAALESRRQALQLEGKLVRLGMDGGYLSPDVYLIRQGKKVFQKPPLPSAQSVMVLNYTEYFLFPTSDTNWKIQS